MIAVQRISLLSAFGSPLQDSFSSTLFPSVFTFIPLTFAGVVESKRPRCRFFSAGMQVGWGISVGWRLNRDVPLK